MLKKGGEEKTGLSKIWLVNELNLLNKVSVIV